MITSTFAKMLVKPIPGEKALLSMFPNRKVGKATVAVPLRVRVWLDCTARMKLEPPPPAMAVSRNCTAAPRPLELPGVVTFVMPMAAPV